MNNSFSVFFAIVGVLLIAAMVAANLEDQMKVDAEVRKFDMMLIERCEGRGGLSHPGPNGRLYGGCDFIPRKEK